MSYRNDRDDDRGYQVVYNTRPRNSASISTSGIGPLDDPVSRQRSRQDYGYDYDNKGYPSYPRGSRDLLSPVNGRLDRNRDGYPPPESLASRTTKTTYDVGRDRYSDPYVKRGNASIINRAGDYGGPQPEYEVLRPERGDNGAYIIEPGTASRHRSGRNYAYDREVGRHDSPPRRGSRYYDVGAAPSRDLQIISAPRYNDDRERSSGLISPMQKIQVTEDSDSDHRSRRRGRRKSEVMIIDNNDGGGGRSSHVTDSRQRMRSSIRHEHSPDSDRQRRSRSIGFYKDQIRHHDASEGRHERPGAEAALAGRYLVGHTADVEEDSVIHGRRGDGRRRSGYVPDRGSKSYQKQTTTSRYRDDDYDISPGRSDNRRTTTGRRDRNIDNYRADYTNNNYEQGPGGPYPPQQELLFVPDDGGDDNRPQQHHHHHKPHRHHHRRHHRHRSSVDDSTIEDDRTSYTQYEEKRKSVRY